MDRFEHHLAVDNDDIAALLARSYHWLRLHDEVVCIAVSNR
jgi:hypothetical protein